MRPDERQQLHAVETYLQHAQEGGRKGAPLHRHPVTSFHWASTLCCHDGPNASVSQEMRWVVHPDGG